MKEKVSFRLNGKPVSVMAYPMDRLLDVIRLQCELTGSKEGCGEGECGACSVFINGKIVNSCLVPVVQVNGAEILTIEGIASEKTLSKVQEAFVKYGGAQCGICTPGMILAAKNLLDRKPRPTLEETKEALAGNLCRCTGYMKIFESVCEAFRTEGAG